MPDISTTELLSAAVASGEREKIIAALSILANEHEPDSRLWRVQDLLQRLNDQSRDIEILTAVKRLLNRYRFSTIYGSDLIGLASPPVDDAEKLRLWQDLVGLKEQYEADDGQRSFESNFDLREKIGEGGMSVIWRGIRRSDGKQVAVKILREEYFPTPSLFIRFRNECKRTHLLEHKHVIEVFESGFSEDFAYLIMEYLPLRGLDNRLNDSQFSLKMRLEALRQVTEAISYVHSRQLVHRDIKLANVLIHSFEPENETIAVKLCDFGICKDLAEPGFTQVGSRLHSEYYGAPEQVHAPEEVDQKADIYSLGVMTYRLISRVAFPVGQDFKPLSELEPRISTRFDGVLKECLKEYPGDRPAEAAVLGAALSDALASL